MDLAIRYLQKMSFLLVMGFFLYAIQACSEDGENASFVDGHEAVDLGLSVKWATCNVGASTPTGYGDYYAWGEISPKSNYDWDTYKWCNGSRESLTKYCVDSEYGKVDNRIVLSSSDDVATVNWGKRWRIPTQEEWEELLDKCKLEWTRQNNVNGCLVVGPSGNSIFLPASGFCIPDGLRGLSDTSYYWSATSSEFGDARTFNAADKQASKIDWGVYWGLRCNGMPVRPVTQ